HGVPWALVADTRIVLRPLYVTGLEQRLRCTAASSMRSTRFETASTPREVVRRTIRAKREWWAMLPTTSAPTVTGTAASATSAGGSAVRVRVTCWGSARPRRTAVDRWV